MAWGGVDTQMRHPEVGEGTANCAAHWGAGHWESLCNRPHPSNLPKGVEKWIKPPSEVSTREVPTS